MADLNPPPGTGTSTALGDALAEALNVGYCLVTDEQSKAFDSAGQNPKLRKRTERIFRPRRLRLVRTGRRSTQRPRERRASHARRRSAVSRDDGDGSVI